MIHFSPRLALLGKGNPWRERILGSKSFQENAGPSIEGPGPSREDPGPSRKGPGPSMDAPGPSVDVPGPSPILDDFGNSLRIRLRRYRPHICAALGAQITNFETRRSQDAFLQKFAQKSKFRFATLFPNRVDKIQPGWNSNLALLSQPGQVAI